ncbi:ATP-binding protein [Sphingobacterium spiritivorum]|uniref:HAMP domain-containing sensor histidine kinase n=1 Tax=Sphingobacterium TaxID=28453 RepID=UPI0025E37238|nr:MULTISPECIES: ATP-binding protein [unclassified Sphingobacterium]
MRSYNKTLYFSIGILIVYTVLFVTFIFYSISNFAFSDFYKRLELRRKLAAERLLNTDHSGDQQHLQTEYIENLFNQKEFMAEIDKQGNFRSIVEFPTDLSGQISKNGPSNFKDGKIFYSTNIYQKDGRNYLIGVSAENYFYTHHLAYLRNLLFISLLFACLLIIVISMIVKRSFLKPIHKIIKEVEIIGSESLYLRLNESKDKSVLNKLAATFNSMLNRIETSFETQKNFISNASHELNTPLTSIIVTADLALSKQRTDEEYRTALTRIMDAAGHLEKKTHALLLLARTGYEGNKINFKPTRVDQAVMDAELMVKQINNKFRIKTDFSLLPEDSMRLKVNGVLPLLHLAFSNIISNACKYSADQTAYIALGASKDKVVIVIKDNGIGIPEKELKHIYDPYFRASNTLNYSGYGIGLPLARNIIHMHNGQLRVSSVEGQGTTVTIELPSLFV